MKTGILRTIASVALSIAIANMSSGCGAIFNERRAVIPVRVNPPGARIYVDGLFVGAAPLTIMLDQRFAHTVDIDADGFERQSTRIESNAGGGYILGDCALLLFLIVPGIIALVVDASADSWNVLTRNQLSVGMAPARTYQPAPFPGYRPPEPPAPDPGCRSDAQCKGDRLCKDGKCVDPQ